MSEESDYNSDKACQAISDMWLALGKQIAAAVPDIIINDSLPTRGMRWAACAEACFWQATGEASSHDMKDVLAWPVASDQCGGGA